ncbi:MAG TPA: alpha/beta hydrolase [Dermatophilaceae bacterium]|nr:alpha/beta hydrolase [Dermatophilaceae bacterium]
MTSTGATNLIGRRRRMRCRTGTSLAGILAVVLTSACSGAPDGRNQARTPSPAQKTSAQALPSGQEKLARFYTQDLTWSNCGPNQCTSLVVPIDYTRPDGATIKLAVLKVAAKSPSDRIGSLVVNPGGPGGSGVEYASHADDGIVTKAVRDVYDIVGFDPRGVGASSPVKCVNDRELDNLLGADPTPDDKAEEQQFVDSAKAFGEKCKVNGGPLLGHVSTIEAAKDMDILRAVLGETKLDYLGKSYGTFLGATYADLFPTKVGRFVLDGALRPDLTSSQVSEGQAVGFETALRAYAQDCVRQGDCPLGGSLASATQRVRDFLRQVDAKPLPVDDPYVTSLTEGWASLGIAVAMYDQGLWPDLTKALRDAFVGKTGPLMKLADSYAERSSKGAYQDNLMQVIYAVNCLDRSDSRDLAHYETEARSLSAKAPTWGAYLAWSSLPCGFWPVPANNAPKKITAAGSGPIVVVGTTRDPATPYQWAQGLASDLENGHLITFDGDGHTAYTRSNSCVDDAVDAYLLKGVVPPPGLRC